MDPNTQILREILKTRLLIIVILFVVCSALSAVIIRQFIEADHLIAQSQGYAEADLLWGHIRACQVNGCDGYVDWSWLFTATFVVPGVLALWAAGCAIRIYSTREKQEMSEDQKQAMYTHSLG